MLASFLDRSQGPTKQGGQAKFRKEGALPNSGPKRGQTFHQHLIQKLSSLPQRAPTYSSGCLAGHPKRSLASEVPSVHKWFPMRNASSQPLDGFPASWTDVLLALSVAGLVGALLWLTPPIERLPTEMPETEAALPPPAPRPPVLTPDNVLFAADSTLTFPERLPLASPSPSTDTAALRLANAVQDVARTVGTDTVQAPVSSQDARRHQNASPDAGASPNDSVRTRRVAERIAALVSRPASDPQTATPAASNELPGTANENVSAFSSAITGTLPEDPGDGPTITGLVTDETQTKIGRDFFNAFYDGWDAPKKDFYYTVVVQEHPMPSMGTRVVVQVNQNTVFQTRLQPKREVIEQAAERAIQMTHRGLQSNLSLNVY